MSADRDGFVASRKKRWEELERLLGKESLDAVGWGQVATMYRSLCADLTRVQDLSLGEDIRTYLEDMAGRAHNRLYGARAIEGLRLRELIGREVPREVRRSWRFFLLASLLFYLPMLIGIGGAWFDPNFAASVLPPEQLDSMESMYSDSLTRASGEDAAMAGFYVNNNVGIAFRCFATGAIVGLGPIFFLIYNGLVLGTVTGYLFSVGNGFNLLQFIAGHSAWELTGIVLSGTGGLRLGWALIETGGKSRAASLRAEGPGLFRLVLGAAALLFVAAAIEGFWSAGPMPAPVKYAFGGFQVLIVAGWLTFGGRRGEAVETHASVRRFVA